MDKRVVFAVAGAGKTSHIIDRLELTSRALIVTYTTNNLTNLKKKIKQKFGYIPEGIKVVSYFSFVYGFCYRPFLAMKLQTTGIYFEPNPNMFARKTNEDYYLTPSRRLYSNRIALLVQEKGLMYLVQERLAKYYDLFIVDEVQDLSGHDFNLLLGVTKSQIEILLVGDFFQHTYDTSNDGRVRASLHNEFGAYKQEYTKAGFEVNETLLIDSWRCSPTVCSFITNELGISIGSHNVESTEIRELADDEIKSIAENNDVVKLFYQGSSNYRLHCKNWGESKGEDDHNDVCVILNPLTYRLYKTSSLNSLNPRTRNKLYVALTRARGNIYFIEQSKLDAYRVASP